MSELDDIADELYSGPPSDFIAHRDAAAKAARSDGDRDLAKQITELRKPTVSAWLMNLLVRDDPGFADQVVALGEGLRDAERSLDGPALRELSTQRRALVRSLTARARKLAQATGQRVGDSVTQELDATLTAALADPQVAREVTSGRLTAAREYAGFGSADTSGPTKTTTPPPKPKPVEEPPKADRPKLTLVKPAVDPEEARRARAEERRQRAVDEASKALAAAERVVAEAQRAHDDAVHLRDESAEQLERVERAAQEAHEEEDELVAALAAIRRKLAAAGKAATIADKDVTQAQANLRHDEKQASTTERELQRAERSRDAAAARRDELVKDAEQVLIESPQQWREWLAENHATSSGIWLVTWRPASGNPHVTYEEAIEEALCFGWIDGQAQTLDADRTMLWLTRRRPGSGWSVLSKQRVARVEADDRMTPVGRAVIDAARADGSWSRYDDADNLVMPQDLLDALEQRPGSREHWETFSEAVRRGILRWIVDAKRDVTRSARIEETADLAVQGIPAHQQVRR